MPEQSPAHPDACSVSMGRRNRLGRNRDGPQLPHREPTSPRPENPSPQPPTVVSRTLQREFSGPVPPPDYLEQYDRVLPGLSERIVVLAESQSRHRQALEKEVTLTRLRNEARGQTFAFVLAALVLAGSIWLISLGRSTEGLVTILGELAALTAIFIYGRASQRKELSEKRQTLMGPNQR